MLNNFTPTILTCTRIYPKTSTLIDPMYYYTEGDLKKELKYSVGIFRGYFWASC